MRITEIQVHLERWDQLVVHSANKSVRILGDANGGLQIDRLDEAEKKLEGKTRTG